jgi:hypothetical protein
MTSIHHLQMSGNKLFAKLHKNSNIGQGQRVLATKMKEVAKAALMEHGSGGSGELN